MPKDLAALLVEEGAVPAEVMERALERQREAGGALDTSLLELGAIPEEALVGYLARAAELPVAPARAWTGADARARRVFPSRVAERHGLAPFSLDGRELSLVATHPVDLGLLDEISFMLSLHLTAHVGPEWRVQELIHRLYGSPLSPRLAALAGGSAAPAAPAAVVPKEPVAEGPGEPAGPPPAPPVTGFARDESEPLEPLAAALQQALDAVDVSLFGDADEGPEEARAEGNDEEPAAEEEPEPDGPPPDRSAPPRWGLEDARAALAAARHRDEVVLAVLRYARDFFEYAALFAVTRDAVAGHDALGAEYERERVRAFAIWSTDPGIFKTVIDTRSPYLGPVLPETPGNEAILSALGRGSPRTALVHPVLLRDRVVCVVYADNGEAPVSARRLGDLALLLAAVGPSFERIIRDRKKRRRPRRPPAPLAAGADRAAGEPAPPPPEEPPAPERPAAAEVSPVAEGRPGPEEEPPPAAPSPQEDTFEIAIEAPGSDDPPEPPRAGGVDGSGRIEPPVAGSLTEIEEAFFSAGDGADAPWASAGAAPPSPAPEPEPPPEASPAPDLSSTQLLPAPAPAAAPASTPAALADRALDADPEAAAASCSALAERRRDPAIRSATEKLRRALLSGIAARATRAARALGAIRDVESIPLLIQVLEASEPQTAQAAADALTGITLQRIGPDARKWLSWWKENRGRGRAEWLFSGLTSADRETRVAAAVELSVAAPPPVAYSADLPPADRERIARAWAGWWARSGHVL